MEHGSASPASARCVRSRSATTTPSVARGPSTSDRDGFFMGEAGADARPRGARARASPRGEDLRGALGYGVSSDATHVTEPDPSGEEPGAGDEDGLRRRGHHCGSGGVRERSRHLDPTWRSRGDSGPEARAWRGAATREHLCRRRRERRAIVSVRRARWRRSSRSSRYRTGCFRPRSTTRRRTRCATSTTSRTRHARRRSRSGFRNSFGFGGHNACVVFQRWRDSSTQRRRRAGV